MRCTSIIPNIHFCYKSTMRALTTLVRCDELSCRLYIFGVGKMCGQNKITVHADVITLVAVDICLRGRHVGDGGPIICEGN